MNKRCKSWLVAIIVGALLLTLASCVEKPQAEVDADGWEGKGEFELTDRDNKNLRERYEEYKENAALAFSNNAPENEELFITESFGEGVKIVGYTGGATIIVVPETIGGKNVLAIGKAFAGGNIRAISLPDTVVSIDKGAFAKCEQLSTMRVPFVGNGEEITHFGYIFGADS